MIPYLRTAHHLPASQADCTTPFPAPVLKSDLPAEKAFQGEIVLFITITIAQESTRLERFSSNSEKPGEPENLL